MPKAFVQTDGIASNGKTTSVPAGQSLQAALDDAQPGDTLILQAGVVYMGPFTLSNKHGNGWITLQSSAVASLPAGARVSPAVAGAMPKLEALSGAVIQTAAGAHNYRFIGLEITPGTPPASTANRVMRWLRSAVSAAPQAATVVPPQAALLTNLVNLGEGDTSSGTLPGYIIFDRCYIHGDATVGARRGIAMNSAYTAVINSYLSDFKQTTVDAQAIEAWNGPGPFKVQNDYLEASGENLMFGGEDPSIQGLVPSDIEVIGNHFAKPLAWMAGNPAYQGTPWSIKNIFELKNARRVLVQGNLFEYNWAQSQDGFSILFTVRDQDGTAPWSVVSDVTFTDNVIQHVADGINFLGFDNNAPSQQTQRILVQDNLFQDVGGSWGDGEWLAMNDGTSGVSVVHNTALQTGSIIFADGRPHGTFTFTDNITPNNSYGIIGTGTGTGDQTLARYFPGAAVQGNVIIGGQAAAYPSSNFFPATPAGVGFANLVNGVYALIAGGPFAGKDPDQQAPGADLASLCAVLNQYQKQEAAGIASCQTPGP